MTTLLTLLERALTDVRDRRLAEAPTERTTLAPVWATPMVRHAEGPAPAAGKPCRAA